MEELVVVDVAKLEAYLRSGVLTPPATNTDSSWRGAAMALAWLEDPRNHDHDATTIMSSEESRAAYDKLIARTVLRCVLDAVPSPTADPPFEQQISFCDELLMKLPTLARDSGHDKQHHFLDEATSFCHDLDLPPNSLNLQNTYNVIFYGLAYFGIIDYDVVRKWFAETDDQEALFQLKRFRYKFNPPLGPPSLLAIEQEEEEGEEEDDDDEDDYF